jgi:hypothetical protein
VVKMRVASFNLNNLFSRFDFAAEVDALPAPAEAPVKIVTELDPGDPGHAKFRTFKGRLVKGKPPAERAKIAARIAAMDADVLAVQEVEDVTTLTAFATSDLKGLGYKHVVLVEGNDDRLIDVGILSRLPIGAVTVVAACGAPTDRSVADLQSRFAAGGNPVRRPFPAPADGLQHALEVEIL